MDHLSELSRQIESKTVVASLFCTWLLYWLAIGIYRVYFHPLSKIPGPKVQISTLLPSEKLHDETDDM